MVFIFMNYTLSSKYMHTSIFISIYKYIYRALCVYASVSMSHADNNELLPHSSIEYERKKYHQSALSVPKSRDVFSIRSCLHWSLKLRSEKDFCCCCGCWEKKEYRISIIKCHFVHPVYHYKNCYTTYAIWLL